MARPRDVAVRASRPAAQGDLRRRAWRWHFLAAVLVIPFVLWQSATGVLYLWSEHWVDQRHAALRFAEPGPGTVALDAQVQAARAFHMGRPVGSVRVSADPARSTQVMFAGDRGLPLASFVDPYRGVLLGNLEGSAWPVGWSRSLHGGWPLGEAGSWLLEIGACWTIVMVLTGLFLCFGAGHAALAAPPVAGVAAHRGGGDVRAAAAAGVVRRAAVVRRDRVGSAGAPSRPRLIPRTEQKET